MLDDLFIQEPEEDCVVEVGIVCPLSSRPKLLSLTWGHHEIKKSWDFAKLESKMPISMMSKDMQVKYVYIRLGTIA